MTWEMNRSWKLRSVGFVMVIMAGAVLLAGEWLERVGAAGGLLLGAFIITWKVGMRMGSASVQQEMESRVSASAETSAEKVRGLREAKERAEKAALAKDHFLAILSHELRTPLTPVYSTLSEWKEEERLPEDLLGDVEMMVRNLQLETRLMDDLLDLTRVNRGKLSLQQKEIDAHELIQQTRDMLLYEFVDKGVSCHIDLQARGSWICGDAARFQQILWNLLKNALKFTPAGGRVWVRSYQDKSPRGENGSENPWLVIEVADTGIGIDPGRLLQVFSAYEQLDETITQQYGGLGLGLALAKALMELHHGTITAASEGVNRGSCFTLRLPTIEPRAPVLSHGKGAVNGQAVEALVHGNAGGGLRILFVEDHRDTARTMSKLLTAHGHHVQTAATVVEALQLASSEHFDLLISDLGLPDGSGNDLLENLRGVQPLPGIALSGYGSAEDVRQSLNTGFREHLTKPVDMTHLLGAIERVAGEEQDGRVPRGDK